MFQVIFLLSLVAASRTKNQTDTSDTQFCNNGTGICVEISKCLHAITLLKQNEVDYIRNITCGFENYFPKVCCPITKPQDKIQFNNITQESSTPTIIRSTRRTTFSTTFSPTQIPNTAQRNLSFSNTVDTRNDIKIPSLPNVIHYTDPLDNNANSYSLSHNVPVNDYEGSHASPQPAFPSSARDDPLPNRSVCGQQDITDRVVGGDLTDLYEYPWMARLKFSREKAKEIEYHYLCGGTLISDRFVLTAAHCIAISRKPGVILRNVVLGEWNDQAEDDCDRNRCSDRPVDVDIEETIPHPSYNYEVNPLLADIALIKLKYSVNFTDFIKPICLPTTEYIARLDMNRDNLFWAAGWGRTEYERPSAVKRKIGLRSVSIDICKLTFHTIINDKVESKIICAGGRKGEDTCSGDSGGPLMMEATEQKRSNWYVYGIISTGSHICGTEGRPAIYTRVSSYMDWIQTVLSR